MARLNIDEKIFSDLRFLNLVTKVGDPEKAMGRLIFFWSAAQRSYAHGSEIKRNDFRDDWRVLIECGFAEERENGFYAKGSEEQFSWLKQKVDAGKSGGNKSVEARRSKSKRKKAQPSAANPLTLTLSPTLTPALDSSDAESASPKSSAAKTSGSRVWNAYQEAYQQAYRQPPVRNSKANALCKQLVERLGEEGAIQVVRFYLTHRSAYYVQRCHPLDACVKDAEGLHTQAAGNHRVSASEARAQDQSQGNEETFARVAARMEARRAGKEVSDAAE